MTVSFWYEPWPSGRIIVESGRERTADAAPVRRRSPPFRCGACAPGCGDDGTARRLDDFHAREEHERSRIAVARLQRRRQRISADQAADADLEAAVAGKIVDISQAQLADAKPLVG